MIRTRTNVQAGKEFHAPMKKAKRKTGEKRSQIAAMPIRRAADGSTELLLVTSRTTRRWIVPKGWPIKGLKDHDAAAREAYEEADKKSFPLFDKRKLEAIKVTPEMREKLITTAARPVWDHWVAETDKKGLPGKEALELVLSLAKKHATTN